MASWAASFPSLAWSFVTWALSLLSFASSSLEHYWAIVWALNLKQMGLVYILVFLFHCIGTCDLFPSEYLLLSANFCLTLVSFT